MAILEATTPARASNGLPDERIVALALETLRFLLAWRLRPLLDPTSEPSALAVESLGERAREVFGHALRLLPRSGEGLQDAAFVVAADLAVLFNRALGGSGQKAKVHRLALTLDAEAQGLLSQFVERRLVAALPGEEGEEEEEEEEEEGGALLARAEGGAGLGWGAGAPARAVVLAFSPCVLLVLLARAPGPPTVAHTHYHTITLSNTITHTPSHTHTHYYTITHYHTHHFTQRAPIPGTAEYASRGALLQRFCLLVSHDMVDLTHLGRFLVFYGNHDTYTATLKSTLRLCRRNGLPHLNMALLAGLEQMYHERQSDEALGDICATAKRIALTYGLDHKKTRREMVDLHQ